MKGFSSAPKSSGGTISSPGGSTPHQRVGDWILHDLIGSGSFAVVWHASHAETGHNAALKEIQVAKLNPKLRKGLEREIATMRRIQDPHCGTFRA